MKDRRRREFLRKSENGSEAGVRTYSRNGRKATREMEKKGQRGEKFHERATGEQGPREKEQKRDKRQRDGH